MYSRHLQVMGLMPEFDYDESHNKYHIADSRFSSSSNFSSCVSTTPPLNFGGKTLLRRPKMGENGATSDVVGCT